MVRHRIFTWIRSLALILAYSATGIAGLRLAATGGGYAAPVWLPTGIAVAAVVLGGRRYLPAIWIGAFLTNFFVGQAFSFSNFSLAATIATGNMLEAFAAWWILRRMIGFRPNFGKLGDVTGFISAALVCPIVSATIGVTAVSLSSKALDFQASLSAWGTWWIGDALGALIIAPILISLAQGGAPRERPIKRGQFALPTVLILMSFVVFGVGLPSTVRPLFTGFLLYSVIVWCALVLPIRRFFYVLGIAALITTVRAYLGQGLFNSGDLVQRLALLQFFLGCISVTLMILNAVVHEGLTAVGLAHEQELALMQAKKMSALGEMSSGIAHEISNPLLVIYGKTDQAIRLLESGNSKPENLLPILEKIDSMARRIEKIIKAVRFYSRKSDSDPFKVVSVRSIVDDTLELCKDHYRNHGVELIVDPISEDLTIECRPVLIAQVLLNLLTNALNAVEQRPQKWVRIRTRRRDEGFVEISVIDSGAGIPEQMRTQIFKPFFTTKEAGEGTGLGLSVSRNIVEAHHGSIQLEADSPNTKFLIWLPVIQPSQLT